MNSERILEDLDRLIARRSILQHPFYQAWSAGRLTREDLATYAQAYYPHVAAFPGYLSTTLEGTTDAVVRAELLDNLREELAEPLAHSELWLRFGEAMGADRSTMVSAEPVPETASTTRSFQQL